MDTSAVTRNMSTVTAKAYDLWYDATAVGADLVVLCWISHGPRAVDQAFDPQIGDRVLVGDEEVPMSARVVRRDGDRVAVQVELPTATNAIA